MHETESSNDRAFASEMFASAGLSSALHTSVFACQLADGALRGGLNAAAVMNEMLILETNGRSVAKRAQPFKGKLLGGIMHKHFFQARHLPHNLVNQWPATNDQLHRAVKKIMGQYVGKTVEASTLAREISERVVSGGFTQRQKQHALTGDWIVYKRHDRKNYYLCLARHDESDQEIFQRFAAAAESEFPELGIRRDGA